MTFSRAALFFSNRFTGKVERTGGCLPRIVSAIAMDTKRRKTHGNDDVGAILLVSLMVAAVRSSERERCEIDVGASSCCVVIPFSVTLLVAGHSFGHLQGDGQTE